MSTMSITEYYKETLDENNLSAHQCPQCLLQNILKKH